MFAAGKIAHQARPCSSPNGSWSMLFTPPHERSRSGTGRDRKVQAEATKCAICASTAAESARSGCINGNRIGLIAAPARGSLRSKVWVLSAPKPMLEIRFVFGMIDSICLQKQENVNPIAHELLLWLYWFSNHECQNVVARGEPNFLIRKSVSRSTGHCIILRSCCNQTRRQVAQPQIIV